MNFFTWNYRCISARGFVNLIKEIKKEFKVSMLCLFETHVSGSKETNIAGRCCFDNKFIIDAQGQSKGYGCFGMMRFGRWMS